MIPQQNPNAWSCLPTAFAISRGVELERWLDYVGHDGSEIVRAGLPDPICRKGFHPNEMIRICLLHYEAVTRIELVGQATPGGQYDPTTFDFGGWPEFERHLFNSRGVLDARTAVGLGHAMAYEGHGDHAIICDPANGLTFQFREAKDAEKRDRFITALWRIDRIES